MTDITDKTFLSELEELIHKYNKSNTSDFVLALYINDCLTAYDKDSWGYSSLIQMPMEELNKYS